jgi:hydroxymethylbilane synthase
MTTAPKNKAIIATRGSTLALWQANYVTGLLKELGVDAEQNVIKTKGDKIQDRFLHEIGGKGLFIKELEVALMNEEADLAIHSLKDMPANIPEGFTLASVLKRHSPADLLIFRDDVAAKLNLPDRPLTPEDLSGFGSITVGTASLRRQAVLEKVAPNLKPVGVRGNVDTRLAKLKAGDWDTLILAEASLDRLDIKNTVTSRQLDPKWFIPCAAQGALAIETATKSDFTGWLETMQCATTRKQVDIERQVLARLGGDCTMPVGVHVIKEADLWTARSAVYGKNGQISETKVEMNGDFTVAAMSDRIVAGLKETNVAEALRTLDIEVPKEFL